MTIELSQYCKTCNLSNFDRIFLCIDSKKREICKECGSYNLKVKYKRIGADKMIKKPKITREYVMENCKIVSQDALQGGPLTVHSVMAMKWPCERGVGVNIPYKQIVDAPEEVITKAINDLVDFTTKHMTRCRLGCRDERI